MSEEDFSISPSEKTAPACSCPLAHIPAQAWQGLLRPPFRKRHPFIFWTLILLLGCLLLFLIFGRSSEDGYFSDSERIALVQIRGPVIDVAPTLDWVRQISRHKNIRGVLVRVDSPGGGAAASQEVYYALLNLSKKMPLAVSMGATAASGGLMVSMAGQRVFASPSTVTGSIGVRMDIPQLQDLMGKIGVGQETLVSAPFKDAASYTHPLTPEDRAYLMGVITNMHNQFVDIVAQGRHMSREDAARLANGKIYTGQEALALGLIDELGGQDSAMAWLCSQTGVPSDAPLYVQPQPKMKYLESLLSLASLLGLPMPSQLEALKNNLPSPAFMY